ncbi:hypothetical protein Lalb_Chr25g0289821 [Lupinus albus]|uniref:Uncharacterized protein n=1 Tax=Lupinus albus TaxID=3870 RepID=A0A6A4N6I8_LUPAL|nr:hypothetical protein Lalb_Chr25g0289821 [Lupinus albus]
MDPKAKHGSLEYINLEGKNVGATMHLHHRSTKCKPKKDCCCVNIYVNNNVQGISNSVLHDSEVKMRNPGVRLYFEDFKVGKGNSRYNNRSIYWRETLGFWLFIFILLALILFFSLLLLSTKIVVIVI